ncbi:MAG: Fic family protein [Bifidobacteriaceae bacterium]|jgi:Fic family protein|nr:Fic family protein [Bifidobacteriaceae bacterium]
MAYQPFPAFAAWKVDFDPVVVESFAARLARIRANSTAEAQRRAVEIATRYAAVDTGAIEGLYQTDRGFTRTVATQSEFWERALLLKGERVQRSIQDALDAYEYVLDAVTGSVPVTQVWIRELHTIMTSHQETHTVYVPVAGRLHAEERALLHGQYKAQPNHVALPNGDTYYYAPPADTLAEMARFIDELRGSGFAAAHPVVQAAYAHYAFIRIHPFADGNGRVARALASVYLYRNPGVPLVIFADQRTQYLDALGEADSDRPTVFIQFLAQRVIDTVNLVAESLDTPATAPEDVAALNRVTAGWVEEGLALAARRLQQKCITHLEAALAALNLPPRLNVTVEGTNHQQPMIPNGYSTSGLNLGITVSANSDAAGTARHQLSYAVAAAADGNNAPELAVVDTKGLLAFEVWRREIDPVETTSLGLRLDAWAQNVARRLVQQLNGLIGE